MVELDENEFREWVRKGFTKGLQVKDPKNFSPHPAYTQFDHWYNKEVAPNVDSGDASTE